jgi:uncharacterized protein with beta-barrel porin domain
VRKGRAFVPALMAAVYATDRLRTASAVLAVAALVASSAPTRASCLVTSGGTVDCGSTTTTDTTDLNGANPVSSDRIQLFDNGASIIATVQSSAVIGGFGLQTTESGASHAPITVNNQGLVTTGGRAPSLQLDGNGGPISYFGNGGVLNTSTGAALVADNTHGSVAITTGAGAISGATGIVANTTGTGAVSIVTGAGLVSGTDGEGIVASAGSGALSMLIGSGGVTSFGNIPAIEAISANANISIVATGNVSANSPFAFDVRNNNAHGIEAISNGSGNIVIGGSGTVFGQMGRGIYALESATALGGILITGTGNTIAGTAAGGCCSAIRGEIDNPADSSDIVIDRSGNIVADKAAASETEVSAGIHALTAGTGNIIIASGVGATISVVGLFGIVSSAYGTTSTGSTNISTGVGGVVSSDGTGVYADNSATAIPSSSRSTISVTNNGLINSGGLPNPVGRFETEGGASVATPAGIVAGYDGGPKFGSASGPYTSCGFFGCTTLTPNPRVNGTVSIVNNGAITAAGNGIFAFNFGNGNVSVVSSAPIGAALNGIEAFSAERGNISVTTSANVITVTGAGIQTDSVKSGTTTINIIGSTTEGGASGVTASSARGAIAINNSGTIQNLSGQPGSLAVATSGAGNATLTNNAGGAVTGIVAMTGTGSNNFANAGIWNTLGGNTFGDSSVNNTGTLNIFGPTTFGGLDTFINRGTLNLAAGGTIGTLTLPGNLSFQSGALYVVALNGVTASQINVGGTAALAGSVGAVLLPGSYSKNETYTIMQAAGGLTGNFSGFSNPGLSGTLTDPPGSVSLTLTSAHLGAGTTLEANQQNVATTLNNVFNAGGTLTGGFGPVFNLTGSSLSGGLSQLSGEVATDAERGAFAMMTEFLNLMLDPFVDGRLGGGLGGQAIGFAPDARTILPPDVALAYAGVLKAPAPASFEQRWTAWAASYGGVNWTNGNAATGSNNVAAQTYGFVGGLDYHVSPDTIVGFALGGGGTAWGLTDGLGTGRSDAFQTGLYAITRSGPAYLAASIAFANHWMTTNRSALGDALSANFDAQSYGVRFEGGYRYGVLPTLGVTPYAALQAQDFHTPSYSESDLTGGGFGLSYAAMNATDVRSELGSRFDAPTLVAGMPLVLRGRLAWAHDWVSNPALDATFQSLPGSSFVVNGAPMPQNSALTSAGAELFLTPRLTLLAKFDGEFAPGAQTYGGSGTLRYQW